MDINAIVPWLSALALLISIGAAVSTFVRMGSKQNATEIAALKANHQAIEKRVQAVEGDLKHLPDRDAAHRLEIAIAQLNGRIETLDERLKPVAAISERMQELLLEQAKR